MIRKLLAGVALAAAIGAGAELADVIDLGDDKPIDAQERCDTYALLARDVDGGKAYVCGVVVDAGTDCSQTRAPELCTTWPVYEYRRLSQSTHVRANRDDGTCLIREPLPGDAGFRAPRFFGIGNRFPRAWAVGSGCEEVAGLVTDKADGEIAEDELLQRKEGGGK